MKHEIGKLKEIIENLHSETFKQFNELKHSKYLCDPAAGDAQNGENVYRNSVDFNDKNIPDCDNDDFSGTDFVDNYQSETSSPVLEHDSGFDDKSKLTDTSPDHSNLSTSPRRVLIT